MTPGTNKKMAETLPLLFSTWSSFAKESQVPENPEKWDENHVRSWLQWARDEFNLEMGLEKLYAIFTVRFHYLHLINQDSVL